MKRTARAAAAFLSAAIMLEATAYAAPYTKDENVYITLDSSGAPIQTIVVNSFKTNGNTTLTDYGVYKNIKNLTSDAKPDIDSGKITWDNIDTDTFYYQGEKDGGELPWNFSITYSLNGKTVTGEEMIGKSGKASITLHANSNTRADKYYTDNYMAQITMILDEKNAENIVCDEAIIASVGSKKQLTFMVIPHRSKTYTITFNANNFEMDGLTIAGLKLSDGIFGSSLDNVSAAVSGMTDGIQTLLDGSGLLKNGADDLVSGINILNTGAQNIESSIPVLTSGMNTLDAGVWNVADAMSMLASASTDIRSGILELDSKSADIANGISAIEGGIGEMTKNTAAIRSGLAQLRSKKQAVDTLISSGHTLNDSVGKLSDGVAQIADKHDEIADGLDTLKTSSTDISALTRGAEELGSGMRSVTSACDVQMQILDAVIANVSSNPQLAPLAQSLMQARYISQGIKSGAESAESGASQLAAGAARAQDGINTLYSAAETFGNAALAMTEGAQTIQGGMNALASGVSAYTDGASSAAQLYSTAETFGESALALAEGAAKIGKGTKTLSEGFDQYASGVGTLADKYIEFDNGMFTADNGTRELREGMTTAMNSLDVMSSVVNELCDGIDTLNSSAAALPGGASQIAAGTQTLYDGVAGVDLEALLSKGKNAKAVSYGAPYTAQPEKVQFLLKTPNLHIEDDKAEEQPVEKQGFFQKLLALFKK